MFPSEGGGSTAEELRLVVRESAARSSVKTSPRILRASRILILGRVVMRVAMYIILACVSGVTAGKESAE